MRHRSHRPIATRAGRTEFLKINAAVSGWRDSYHWVLSLSWPRFALFLLGSYIVINLLFAALYIVQPNCIADLDPGSFPHAFFFSVETLATVGYGHNYPATVYGDQLDESERIAAQTVRTLGLETGIAFPQLIAAPDGRVVVVECAARIPGGQMADLVRHAVGVDLVEVQLRMALGEPLPDELVLPRFRQPLAIRFLTAEPGPLPAGRVTRIGPLDPVLAAPGVVQAETYLALGETIRPVRLDGDRRGYVIAVADTSLEALDRAEDAAELLEVEVEVAEG